VITLAIRRAIVIAQTILRLPVRNVEKNTRRKQGMKRNAVLVKRNDNTNRNHTNANPVFVNKPNRNIPRKKSWIFAEIKKTEITLLLHSNRKNTDCGFVNGFLMHTCVYAAGLFYFRKK
jgi:hypothetical protein